MSEDMTTQPAGEAPEATTVAAATTEQQTPAPAGDQVETTQQDGDAPAKEGEEKPEADKPSEGDPKPEEKPRNRAQERIKQLLDDKKAAEARAAAAEARAKALETAQAPKPEAFDDPADYQAAVTKHAVQQARAEDLRTEAQDAAAEAERARAVAWNEKVSAAADRFPDFREVVTDNQSLPITPAMAELITENENGPAIAYYLGKNPQEAARIARLSPAQQGVEIGRIEGRVTLPPPKKVSSAPPPAPVVTGGGAPATTPAPSDMPMDQFADWLIKQVG